MKIQELADGNGPQAAPGDSVEFDYFLRSAHLAAARRPPRPAACGLLQPVSARRRQEGSAGLAESSGAAQTWPELHTEFLSSA